VQNAHTDVSLILKTGLLFISAYQMSIRKEIGHPNSTKYSHSGNDILRREIPQNKRKNAETVTLFRETITLSGSGSRSVDDSPTESRWWGNAGPKLRIAPLSPT
jgi:hypothetical protein